MLYTEVKRTFKINDILWACAFKYTGTKENRLFFQKPIKGVLLNGKTEAECLDKTKRGCLTPAYFAPYKANGVDICWSKVVHLDARHYAETELECINIYNELIQKNIDWHEQNIIELKKELIP